MSDSRTQGSRTPALAGLFAGASAWYAAHDIGLYFSGENCQHGWIAPTVHAVALIICLAGATLSFRTLRATPPSPALEPKHFLAILGCFAGLLFALVLMWQGAATLVYSGCER
jgi:hypothetical protein